MRVRPSRHPRHRRAGPARLGVGANRVRSAARGTLVLGLTAILATGAASAATPVTGRAPDGGAASVAQVLLTAAPVAGAASARGATAELRRWEAQAQAQVERLAHESLAVAAAALGAAEGLDPLRISPTPVPALADLDRAVADLRVVSSTLAAPPSASADRTASALVPTVPARVAAVGDVQRAAAEVFRLSLVVERTGPQTGAVQPTFDLVGLTGLEQSADAATAAAATLGVVVGAPPAHRAWDAMASGPLREDGTIAPELLCPVSFAPQARLRCDAADALARLNEVFRAEHGGDLPVGGTYRTLEEQVALKAAKGSLAATPGTSHHGWGVAVDFEGFGGVGQFDTLLYQWMAEHAPTFGWVHPTGLGPGGAGPLEPWHWEFAGAPLADHP